MIRKAMRHGPSTLTVSLPHQWVKQTGIKKGDDLTLTQTGKHILVSPDTKSIPTTTTIDVTGLDRTSLKAFVRSAYRQGYDDITITFAKPTTTHLRLNKDIRVMDAIREEINQLIGAEIIHETPTSCLIRDLTGTDTSNTTTTIRRIFLLVTDASDTVITGLATGDANLLATVENKHNITTKLISYATRALHRTHSIGPATNSTYHTILVRLDGIIDLLKYAARAGIAHGAPASPDLNTISALISKNLTQFSTAFHTPTPKNIISAAETRLAINRHIAASNFTASEHNILFYLRGIPESTHLMTESVFGLACNRP